jgi:hypothetical protein
MNVVLIYQNIAVLAALPFGLVGLAIARRTRPSDRRRDGWLLTGWCFLITGAVGGALIPVSHLAVASGPESAIWRHYVALAPGANYARMLAVAVLAVALIVLSVRSCDRRSLLHATFGGIVLALVAGFAAGAIEGPLGETNHVARLAVITAATVLLLLAGLLIAAATDVIDQLLWLALAAYTLKQALSVSLFSILAWMAFSTGVRPTTLFLMHVAGWVVILLFALRRYHAAVCRREVPALFERVDSLRKHRVLT